MTFPTCAIMILNWNGVTWLEKCLPSITMAADKVNAEVWVVDNNSSDLSLAFCQDNYPSVRFEALGINKVLASYNIAALRCNTEVLVFLNNDVIVDEDFLLLLLPHLCGSNVFAVSPCVRTFPPNQSAEIEFKAERPRWANGMLRGETVSPQTTTYSWYTLGGAMACSRTKFLSLQGFDELYLPGYHEDIDLCWRAWKQGWTCLYEPQSIVYHAGGSSFGRSERIRTIAMRNEFLFHWKNLTSLTYLIQHILALLPRLMLAASRGDKARLKGFLFALGRLGAALKSRNRVRRFCTVSDVEVIQRSESWNA